MWVNTSDSPEWLQCESESQSLLYRICEWCNQSVRVLDCSIPGTLTHSSWETDCSSVHEDLTEADQFAPQKPGATPGISCYSVDWPLTDSVLESSHIYCDSVCVCVTHSLVCDSLTGVWLTALLACESLLEGSLLHTRTLSHRSSRSFLLHTWTLTHRVLGTQAVWSGLF